MSSFGIDDCCIVMEPIRLKRLHSGSKPAVVFQRRLVVSHLHVQIDQSADSVWHQTRGALEKSMYFKVLRVFPGPSGQQQDRQAQTDPQVLFQPFGVVFYCVQRFASLVQKVVSEMEVNLGIVRITLKCLPERL